MLRRGLLQLSTAVGDDLVRGAFRLAATLRGSKPVHPRGMVLDAVVRRAGGPVRWGAPWLDEPGTDHGVVRLSRAAGLPAPLPDVLGLALRFADGTGLHDVLLATTGLGRLSRFLLVPRREAPSAPYSSLLPYHAPSGRVLLAAAPDSAGPAATLRFRLLAARPGGPWQEFGVLEVESPAGATDADLAFDPVLHPLPGLELVGVLARLREDAYAGARRGRRAAPAELVRVP